MFYFTYFCKLQKYVIKISLSPSFTMLACLYGTGSVSVWNFPKITLVITFLLNYLFYST